jgi:hypothetical protein
MHAWRGAGSAPLAIGCILGVLVSGEAACSQSSPRAAMSDAGGSSEGIRDQLVLAFNPGFSAYVSLTSQHAFQIPVAILGLDPAANVEWGADHPDIVAIYPGAVDFGPGNPPMANAMVSPQGTGDVQIIVMSSGKWGEAALHITAATDDLWTIGEERYKNGSLLTSTGNGLVRDDAGRRSASSSTCVRAAIRGNWNSRLPAARRRGCRHDPPCRRPARAPEHARTMARQRRRWYLNRP